MAKKPEDRMAILARIDQLIAERGTTEFAVSTAVGRKDLIRDLRRKGTIGPDGIRLLADYFGVSVDWLRYEEGPVSVPTTPGPPHKEAYPDFQRHYERPQDEPPTVPVWGSGLGATVEVDADGVLVSVETLLIFPNEAVDQLRRPFRLIGRPGIYAFYFEGDSMEPKYSPGEPAFVDGNKPPVVMDYVLVQLRRPEGDDETIHTVLAKRLVKRTAAYVELEQFNPPMRFKVPREQIARMHKILQSSDIYSV
ncbi:putative phage repressor [Rhizorhabdus wittichii RW1]|uniref:Phage repressor n=1 Tax=Rhizorhabdus wittichii (strain DSM 6014 / CCUG 31198 / JCM 15750 / NBRC 105917 / EY 4224 / RW1) TaxID=392499 RepID=A0A9J9LEA7_RHIWR|nr:putative phage repressor [Rhizorhabdus wittichii RW1]